MKIGLFKPDREQSDFPKWERGISFAPLTLETIAASVDRDADFVLQDESASPFDLNVDMDIAGISINTATAKRGYEIAEELRKKGVYTVLGGVHVGVRPNEAAKYADSLVIGEAEIAFNELIEDFANGGPMKEVYQNQRPFDLKDLKSPRRDLHVARGPLEAVAVESSRGCNNSCKFCAHPPYTQRPAEDVAREIMELESPLFSFSDLNIGANSKHLKEILQKIKGQKKTWFGEIQSTMLSDESFLELAAQTGCGGLFVGYEATTKETLANTTKSFNSPENYRKDIARAHQYGIAVKGSFIFGFDSDTVETIDSSVKTAIEMGLDVALFNVLTPFPGTQTFDDLAKEGRLLYTNFPSDWSKYHKGKAVFQPKNMTPGELESATKKAWRDFHSEDSIRQRFPKSYLASGAIAKQAFALNMAAHEALQ
jgi:radical SAM superfamily enzyme YgiQ (UPF0313 family)